MEIYGKTSSWDRIHSHEDIKGDFKWAFHASVGDLKDGDASECGEVGIQTNVEADRGVGRDLAHARIRPKCSSSYHRALERRLIKKYVSQRLELIEINMKQRSGTGVISHSVVMFAVLR